MGCEINLAKHFVSDGRTLTGIFIERAYQFNKGSDGKIYSAKRLDVIPIKPLVGFKKPRALTKTFGEGSEVTP